MCLTLHLDNKRFLCLFVKFVLYRGPVLCEKHRISFFISIMCPVSAKTFFTYVVFILVHVVRKTGLSTHAGNAPRSPRQRAGLVHARFSVVTSTVSRDAATPRFWGC